MITIRYTLFSASQGLKQIYTQPNGWSDDMRKLKRSTDSYGILYDFIEDVEFTRDGYDFIENTERLEGFDAQIIIKREVKNREDAWVLDYQGELDLTTKQQTKNGVKVNIVQGGLTEALKSINNEKYELSRSTSVDGDDIGFLTYEKGLLNGRDLLITSKLEEKQTQNKTLQEVLNSRVEIHHVPRVTKVFSGDSQVAGVFSIPETFYGNVVTEPNLSGIHFFYLRALESKTIELSLKYDADVIGNYADYSVFPYIYKYLFDGTNYQFVSVVQVGGGSTSSGSITLDIDTTLIIDLLPDECLAFSFNIVDVLADNTAQNIVYDVVQRDFEINIEDSSSKEATTFSGLTIEQCYKRISKIATGQDSFKSDYFNNGDFKDAIITNGKRIRNFGDSIELSLKQLNDSCRAMFNTSMGVETINNVERFRVEPFEYFFSTKKLFDLGKVYKVTETYNDKFLFGNIDAGYKKGGDYEEQQGLDEYNTQLKVSHNFKKVDNSLDAQSDTRTDTIGVELTRRKQAVDFPTEDTTYDKDNFIIDCYKNSELYINRPYDMDFETLPTGIFSPETAYNLRLTPKNNLYRISKSFAWLSPYADKVTNFVSGTRNTELTTRLIGGTDRTENTDINNDDLSRPLLTAKQVTFQYKLTPEQFTELKSNTDGIPNWYKLISYQNDRTGEIENGWILEYNPKDEGQLTLIKANI